jgi:hypothetical protein
MMNQFTSLRLADLMPVLTFRRPLRDQCVSATAALEKQKSTRSEGVTFRELPESFTRSTQEGLNTQLHRI